ncbi:MAG: DNA ligase [Bacillota bacterium]
MFKTPIRPMEPVLCPEAFDDDGWTAQVKWDGVRCLAYLDGDSCRLFNKRLHERTFQYPELQELKKISRSRTAVLDGEVIVLSDGKPSFSAVLRRDWATNQANIRSAIRRLPVNYMIFDIIGHHDRDLTKLTFNERQEILCSNIIETETIRLVENFPGMGNRLFQAVKEQNLEGVVLKRSDSPYVPGKKSSYWHKVKALRRQLCHVGGFTLTKAGLRSLLLGVPGEDSLVYAGRASIGLTETDLKALHGFLSHHLTEKPPFKNPPRVSGVKLQWVKPVMTVEIEFLEWTDDLQLRHPKIIKLNLP